MDGNDVIPPERGLLPGEADRNSEVYRYFQPPQPAERGSTNLALWWNHPMLITTVRFIALQLRKHRVAISLVENGAQWIIAEAIQKAPVFNMTDYWLDGFTESDPDTLQNGQNALCHAVVTMQPSRSARKDTIRKKLAGLRDHIVPFSEDDGPRLVEFNDMNTHSVFCKLPCVTKAPKYKAYIGVPLRTQKGIFMGSLCIYDINAAKLSTLGRSFVREMASNIVQYLDMTIGANARGSSIRMHNSMFQFVDPTTLTIPESSNSGLSTIVPSPSSEVAQPVSSNPYVELLPESPVNEQQRGLTSLNEAIRNSSVSSDPFAEGSSQSHTSSNSDGALTPSTDAEFPDAGAQTTTPSTNDAVFSRACQLVRDAFDVDGVVIVDTGLGPGSNAEAAKWAFPGTTKMSPQSPTSHGVAIRGIDVAPELNATGNFQTGTIEGFFLKELSNAHPDGKIFTYGDCAMTQADFGAGNMRKRSLYVRYLMSTFLPGSKSCIYMPLIGASGAPFGSLFVWTTQETKVFVKDEVGYLKTFGQVVMSEVARQNAVTADREKEGFISSITHELRSPLYGIMGASDGLRRTILDEHQKDFLSMITVSGNALKDTLNHVLDFSKLTRFLKDGTCPDLYSEKKFANVDLASCTEEIVRGVFNANDFLRTNLTVMSASATNGIVPLQPDTIAVKDDKTADIPKSKVDVIIDIDHYDNWLLRTDISGYRRVLTNLLGNALKYTDSGYVRVKLAAEPYIDSEAATEAQTVNISKSRVILTISDTGRGISPEFLPNLFVPFSQENKFSAGTGLGMSIVKQIADIFKWKIEVSSRLGIGTDISLSLILDHGSEQNDQFLDPTSLGKPKEKASTSWISQTRKLTKGKKIAFVAFNDDKKQALTLIKSSIMAYSREWYNMEVIELDTTSSLVELNGKVDIVVLNEDSWLIAEIQMREVKLDVIVVCSKATRVLFSRMTKSELPNVIDCVWKPCGPRAFAQTLRRCLAPGEYEPPSFMDAYSGKKMQRRLSAFSRDTFGPELNPAAGSSASATEDGAQCNTVRSLSRNRPAGSRPSSTSSSPSKRKSTPILGNFPSKILQAQTAARASMDAIMFREMTATAGANHPGQSSPLIHDNGLGYDEDALGEKAPEERPSLASPLNERENPIWLSILENIQGMSLNIETDDVGPPPAPPLLPPPEAVLVVDDNDTSRKVTARALNRQGFVVVEVVNGQEAVDIFDTYGGGFAAVCMDINLPVMNGLDATRAIRKIERAEGNPGLTFIVALTGGDNIEEALAAGCDKFCTKPLDLHGFDSALEYHQTQYALQKSSLY
ncbi:hypothetical protein ABW21_db0205006 [Orbilia brochopaga]|nr:hypothetical protein ABW21_db0205006 [Drechslerella brochopaga]